MDSSALVTAYAFDGRGGGQALDWGQIATWSPGQGVLWVHLNRDSADTHGWLQQSSGLDPLVVEALLAEETRPRCERVDGGVMIFLRGVNLNPGSVPEDMVSIRLWVDEHRIISVRLRPLLSVDDVRRALDEGRGPTGVGDFLISLSDRLVSRMAHVISNVDDEVDAVQALVVETHGRSLRTELSKLRRGIIALRRYLAPQRDAMLQLSRLKLDWLPDDFAFHIGEEADRVTRYVEDLDAARERAAVTQEELASRLSEQMNTRMYVLSLVAGIFLPLGFLTGLLGVNVGGIPGTDNPSGFVLVVLLLAGIALAEWVVFKWWKWF